MLFIKQGGQYTSVEFYWIFLTLLNSVVLFQTLPGERLSLTARKDPSPMTQMFLSNKCGSEIEATDPRSSGKPTILWGTFLSPKTCTQMSVKSTECSGLACEQGLRS